MRHVFFLITYSQEEDSQNQNSDSLHCYRVGAVVFLLFLSVCQGGLHKCRLPKTRTYRENECSLVLRFGSMGYHCFR